MLRSGKNHNEIETGKINIYMIVYMFIWVLVLLFLMWRARFGAASYDESLYLTIPYRLWQGDAMMWDEWNLSQMSSLATIPFVSAYAFINKGTDGITLAYRYCSVVAWSLVSLAIYFRLRRSFEKKNHAETAAMFSSLIFMIYAPFGLMVMSYNTYAIAVLVLAGLILLPGQDSNGPGHIRWAVGGFLYAYSVLCCPHILLLWGLGLICAIIRKKLRCFLDFTLGAAGMAAILGIYILSKASVNRILTVIPVMLSDPYHQQISLWGYAKDYVLQVLYGIPGGIWVYVCLGLLIIMAFIDKHRTERRGVYFIAGCVLTIILLILAWVLRRYINCFIYPVNILAFICIILEKRWKDPAFWCLWIPGMLYSFCINMSSNQYWLAISSASMVALVGSVVIIGGFVSDMNADEPLRRLPTVLYSILVLLIIFMITAIRYDFIFPDGHINMQTGYIDRGPQVGIMASSSDKELYDRFYNDLEAVNGYTPDRVLIFSRVNWPYLAGTWRCGAFSPWLQNEIGDYAVSQLMKYYLMDEARKPDVIYIDSQYIDYADRLLEELDYDIAETLPSGNMIAAPVKK